MMTLRDLINKLLGRETSSANTARERLQLVLAHDRVDMSSLTTDLLDKMRKEILDVVAKYVEIDFEEVAVSLETEDRMTALVANLPIKRTISGEIKFKKTDNSDKALSELSVFLNFISPEMVLLIGKFATNAVILSSVSKLTATSSKSISTYLATTSRISFLILSKRSVVKELISTLS